MRFNQIFKIFCFVILLASFAYPKSNKSILKDVKKLYLENDFDNCLLYLNTLEEKKYKLQNVYDLLGDVYLSKQYYKEAIKYFNLSLEKTNNKKQQVETLNKLGYSYFKDENFVESINTLKNAILIFPDNSITYFYLGLVYEKIFLFDNAEDMYEKAIKINPKKLDILESLANVYEINFKYEKAIFSYKTILKNKFNVNKNSYNLARLYWKIGKINNAYDIMKNLDESNFNSIYSRFLGDLLYAKSDYKDAIEKYKQSLLENSLDYENYIGLALSYIELKDYDEVDFYINKIKYNNDLNNDAKNFIIDKLSKFVILKKNEK
jgi:tetratricopeptide (TPR) repeat protein